MPDEIDRHIDSIRSETRRQATFQEWVSQYAPMGTLTQALKPLESPHLDLVVEFSGRALSAQLGNDRLILQGPDAQLYAVALLNPATTLVKGRRPSWFDKQRVRRANKKLTRDGRPATLLAVKFSDSEKIDYVSAAWFVAGTDLYEERTYGGNEWGRRDDFARACAQALAKHT